MAIPGPTRQIPFREEVYKRLKGIHEAESARYYSVVFRNKLFAMKIQPRKTNRSWWFFNRRTIRRRSGFWSIRIS